MSSLYRVPRSLKHPSLVLCEFSRAAVTHHRKPRCSQQECIYSFTISEASEDRACLVSTDVTPSSRTLGRKKEVTAIAQSVCVPSLWGGVFRLQVTEIPPQTSSNRNPPAFVTKVGGGASGPAPEALMPPRAHVSQALLCLLLCRSFSASGGSHCGGEKSPCAGPPPPSSHTQLRESESPFELLRVLAMLSPGSWL